MNQLGADIYVLALPDEFSSRAESSSGSITFDSVPCSEGEGLVEFSVESAVVSAEDASDSSVLFHGSFSGSFNELPQRDIYRQDCLLAGGCTHSSLQNYEGPPVGPEASVIRPDVDCGAPGFYEASRTAPETVVITASWVGQCDASHTVKLTIVGSGVEASSAEVEYKSSANGEPEVTWESLEVRVDQFSLDGVISGSWGQMQFWAVVDRPTRVELDDTGSARLELGQAVWTGPPSCLIHNDGSLDASGAPLGVLHSDCDDSTLRQVGFEGTAVLVSTEGG